MSCKATYIKHSVLYSTDPSLKHKVVSAMENVVAQILSSFHHKDVKLKYWFGSLVELGLKKINLHSSFE